MRCLVPCLVVIPSCPQIYEYQFLLQNYDYVRRAAMTKLSIRESERKEVYRGRDQSSVVSADFVSRHETYQVLHLLEFNYYLTLWAFLNNKRSPNLIFVDVLEKKYHKKNYVQEDSYSFPSLNQSELFRTQYKYYSSSQSGSHMAGNL